MELRIAVNNIRSTRVRYIGTCIELSATEAPDESQNIMDLFVGKDLLAGLILRMKSRYLTKHEVEQPIRRWGPDRHVIQQFVLTGIIVAAAFLDAPGGRGREGTVGQSLKTSSCAKHPSLLMMRTGASPIRRFRRSSGRKEECFVVCLTPRLLMARLRNVIYRTECCEHRCPAGAARP
jgi:hypothetical protein